MHLRILGCSGSRNPGEHSTAFLIDGTLLLDAGTVCATLTPAEQSRIDSVVITHPHLDHVCGLASLADNLLQEGNGRSITVHSTADVLEILRENLFNGLIWPDFGTIPDLAAPVIRWQPLDICQSYTIAGYRIMPIPVNHAVPAVGYLIASGDSRLLFTGDTGPTDLIWYYGERLALLVAEVSFPNRLEDLARRTGHLTPHLLQQELLKLPGPPQRIMATHLKSAYRDEIIAELAGPGIPPVEIMQDGEEFRF